MKSYKEMFEDMYSSDYKYNPRTGRKTKAKRIAFNYGSDDKKVEKNDKKVEEKMDLSKADMGDVIKDFKGSDAPQFKGKSDEKKREMAIAAKLQADDMKKEVKEGMGHIDAIQKMMAKEREDQAKKKAVKKEEVVDEAETTVTRDKAGKVISFKHVGDWKKSTPDDKKKNPIGKVTNLAGKAMQAMKKMNKEEVAIEEAKDEQEYGYEGAMATTQLKTLIRHAEHMMGMLDEDTDLPEWVQSKVTLATDYMQTAHDYMMSEMSESKKLSQKEIQSALTSDKNKAKPKDQVSLKKAPWDMKEEEELDEKSDQAKQNKTMKNTMDASRGARYKAAGNPVPDADPKHKTGQQHNKAIGRALRNEEIEEDEVKVSYRDFIKEYESKDGKYVHKGSYGSSYKDPEGDDEPSAKKPSAKKTGRPAGAKSGALQNRQPIKFK
jgi:hypothetical protein